MNEKFLPETKTKEWVFYTASFFNWFSYGIIGPLFIIYLLSINFNPAQIGILLAIERISTIIFDTPTGAFADRYGRKNSLLICFSLTALVLLIWFLSQNFFILLAISIIWGFASTFQSGAEESLIIDSLNLEEDDKKRNKTFSRISIFGNLGFLVGGLIAALLVFYSIRSIWLAACFLNVIIFILYLIFAKEKYLKTKFFRSKSQIKEILKTTKNNFIFSLKTRTIFLCFGITLIFGLTFAVYSLSYPILFKETFQFPNYYFGFLGALSAAAGILGAFLGEKLAGKKGYYYSISFFAVVLLILYFVFGFSKNLWLALVFFTIIELTKDGWFPVYQSFLNKFIPTRIRAGVLSINSTLGSLALALGELLAGFLLTFLYPGSLIIFSGLLFIFVPILLTSIKKAVKN